MRFANFATYVLTPVVRGTLAISATGLELTGLEYAASKPPISLLAEDSVARTYSLD